VPPEVRLTQEVSSLRASASAIAVAASGRAWIRNTHSTQPSRCATGCPTTRNAPAERSRRYRRATV
jgi:hypothetical protein